MKHRSWLLGGLLCASLMASAQDSAIERYSAYVTADVTIDRSGKVAGFALVAEHKNLPDALRACLEALVRAATFVPAQRDGQPAETKTSLALELAVVPDAEKQTTHLSLVGLKPTPRIRVLPTPAYPASALARNDDGLIKVKVTIGPDGLVRDAQVVDDSPTSRSLRTAALHAAKRSSFYVEQVDGLGVGTEAIVQFRFFIAGESRIEPSRILKLDNGTKLVLSKAKPDTMPDFAESTVKLASDVAETIL